MAEDVHQATAVGADHALGAAGLECLDLVLDHRTGNFRLLDREGAAEATAFGFVILLGDLDALERAKQLPSGEMDTHFAAGRARGVEYDGFVLAMVFRLEFKDIDQEVGQFVNAGGEGFGLWLAHRIGGKQGRVVVFHHAGAGAGRYDDRPVVREQRQLQRGDLARFVGETAGVGRLAAAGLLFREMNADAFALQ